MKKKQSACGFSWLSFAWKTKAGCRLPFSDSLVQTVQEPATHNPFMWFGTQEVSITYAFWHAAHGIWPSA